MESYHIDISSPPDREKLVASISFNNIEWAEISQEHGDFEIEFYSKPDGSPWKMKAEIVIEALNKASEKLRQYSN